MIGQSIDVTKLKGYKPSSLTMEYLIPKRHACGRILYANLASEYPVFYTRQAVTGHNNILKTGQTALTKCPHCPYPLNMDWMRPLYYIRPMPYYMAMQTKARRVCSNCWGELEIENHRVPVEVDEKIELYALIWCPVCKYETIGFVTRRFAEESKRKNDAEYKLYTESMEDKSKVVNQPKKSAAESLALLGY